MSLKNGENPSDQEWLKAAYKMLVGLVMVIVLRSTMFYFIMLIVMFSPKGALLFSSFAITSS